MVREREDYYDPGYELSQQERLATKAEMVYERKRQATIAQAQVAYEQTLLRRGKMLDVMEEQRQRTRAYERVETQAYETSLRREIMSGVMEEQRERIGYYETEATPEELAFKRSMSFYRAIGYPEYAGKYGAFTIPEGYKVSEIIEGEEGLEISFESTKPKGIAQQILEFDIPSYFADIMGFKGEKREKYLGITSTLTAPIHVLPSPFGTPVESLAGFVAYPETLTHTGMTLLGFEPATRPPPPLETSEGYTMGYAMGWVGSSLITGKAIEISPLGKSLAKAEMWAMSKIRDPLIGTRLDVFLLKHSKYWATLQEYKAGTVVFGAKPAKWKPSVYHGKATTPMSVTLKKAIMDTRGSVLLPKLFTTPKTLFTPTETTLPFSFFPKVLGVSTALGMEPLLRTELRTETLQAPKLINIEKMLQIPKVKPLERQKPITFGFPETRLTQREELFAFSASLSKSLESAIPGLGQQQEVTQAQSLKQMQKQVQQLISVKRLKFPEEHRRKKKKRKVKGFFDMWFFKEHPISPSKILGLPGKTRRRKK